MRLLPLTLCFALAAASAHGEAIPTLTLPEALARARANNPAVQASLARLAAQETTANIPRAQWLPSVGASAQTFYGTSNTTTAMLAPSSALTIPRIGSTAVTAGFNTPGNWNRYGSTFVGVGANQQIYDFGRIAAQVAQEDARAQVARDQSHVTQLDVAFLVEESYFAVLASKAVLQASEDAYQRSLTHRDFAQAGVRSGLRSPIELARAQADLARFETQGERARGGVTIAQSTLAAAVGLPDLLLDASAPPPTAGEAPTLQEALDRAYRQDPWLRTVLSRLELQEAQTRALRAEWRPDLHFTSTFSTRAGGAPGTNDVVSDSRGWGPDVPNWDVGLLLTVPLFDGVLLSRIHTSEAEERARVAELTEAKRAQMASVQQAYISLDVARQSLPGLATAVTAALANYAQADARFRGGLGTSVELADAEALPADPEIQLALGRFQVARSRAVLGRAVAEGL